MSTLTNASQTPANPTGAPSSDVPSEILRDQWGRPLVVRPDGTVGAYTRASSLGGTLEDQHGIGEWKMKLVAWAVAHSRPLQLEGRAIATTDAHPDKQALGELVKRALNVADSDAAARIGTAYHAMTERIDAGEPVPDVGDEDRYALEAYAELMADFTVHSMETFTVCPELETAGTFDRLLSPKGVMTAPDGTTITPDDRLIDDLKTSSSARYFGLKFAVQLVPYAHGTPYRGWEDMAVRAQQERDGVNVDSLKAKVARTRGEYLDWPDGIAPRTDWALIMHVPSGGSSATLHWVNLRAGMEAAQLACTVRDWRKRKDLVVPAERPSVPMDTALNGAGLRSLIEHAADRQACKALWVQHKSMWTAEHTALVTARFPA